MNSKRVKDLLNIACGAYMHACRCGGVKPNLRRPQWFVDVTQSAERQPWGKVLPCVGTKSRVYSFALDQVVTPRQLGHLHGCGARRVDGIPQADHRALIGNSMFLPQVTIAILSAFCNPRVAQWFAA